MNSTFIKLSSNFVVFLFLISCVGEALVPTKGPEGEPGSELNFAQFDDIPIPIGSSLNQEESIIISKNKSWLGRLVFDSNKKQLSIFDFFRNELPKFGWKKLSEVRADSSLLNYTNENRVASIQIFSNTFFGSKVSITVTETAN
jgi:hypothetical protein|tara:strand:+ start:311 stop:742 length:432 start_codon:yes stop_codon:yes gene_type:complete